MNLTKMVTLLTGPRYWRALGHRVAPNVEHRSALADLRPCTVIDVGANKGQFAYLANTLWPDATLFCFEPLPKPRSRLIRLMGKSANVHACALGETDGTATIHIASREDSSSLLPLERQRELFHMDEIDSLEVPVRRLDAIIPPDTAAPLLLKIDVQGFEYEVLRGASQLLGSIDWVYVEASFIELYEGQKLAAEVSALLTNHGFRLAGQYNAMHRGGQLVQADLLFVSDRTSD